MSINLKSPEAERLARDLAAATGESLTGAVTVALRERLERIRSADHQLVDQRLAAIRAIGQDASTRWKEPYRHSDHSDILYDEVGLPR